MNTTPDYAQEAQDYLECEKLWDFLKEHPIVQKNHAYLGRAQGAFDVKNVESLREVKRFVLVDELTMLQSAHNDGRGISCVRQIAGSIRQKDLEGAKAITHNDWDKIANYPDVCAFLKQHGFADENWYIRQKGNKK
jgi:hypothetical protein